MPPPPACAFMVLCLAEPERWGRSVATRLIALRGPAGAFWAYYPPVLAAGHVTCTNLSPPARPVIRLRVRWLT